MVAAYFALLVGPWNGQLAELPISVYSVSGDGTTVAGYLPKSDEGQSDPRVPCVWTAKSGVCRLDFAGHRAGSVTAVSRDGRVAVGLVDQSMMAHGGELIAYWDPKLHIVCPWGPNFSIVVSLPTVSGDGKWVVGDCERRAFRWSVATGMMFLPPLDPANPRASATAVSQDGSVVFGASSRGILEDRKRQQELMPSIFDARGIEATEACVWLDGKPLGLGRSEGADWSVSEDMTTDGEWAVGRMLRGKGDRTFLWSREGGRHELAEMPGYSSWPWRVYLKGRLILGQTLRDADKTVAPMVWADGVPMLGQEFMESRGFDTTGWTIYSIRAASDDGKTLVGDGTNPQGRSVSWLARLK